MSRALVTKNIRSGAAGNSGALRQELTDAGATITAELPHGFVIDVDDDRLVALGREGFRVSELPPPNILRIGGTTIDVEAEADGGLEGAPAGAAGGADDLRVAADEAPSWTHRLVQLIAPPSPEWVEDIQDLGVQVVEPLGPYGLFVLADEDQAAELARRPYVRWTGLFQPAYRRHPALADAEGRVEYVGVTVVPAEAIDEVRSRLVEMGADIRDVEVPAPTTVNQPAKVVVDIDASLLADVARIPNVRWIEPHGPDAAVDERSTQIVAENLDGVAAPNSAPVLGYQGALAGLGLSGAGVIIGICDSGIDSHNNATMHGDLAGRLAFFADATGGASTTDTNGHGTHVAGIAAGNAFLGNADPQGFLLGQGVAPGAQIGSVNQIGTGGTFNDTQRVQQMALNGASVMNNSWGQTGAGPGGGAIGMGYTARSRSFDELVRDPEPATPVNEHLAIVSAAGNDGTAGATSVSAPWEAKNPIIVGNSRNFRPGEGSADDDIRGISNSSGRGPAVDGRILPTVVAPGTDIISARSTVDANAAMAGVQRPRTAYTDTGGTVHQDYTRLSGTSMAAPHVAGLCALLIEWWRDRTGGRQPSHALLKALLVNGAEDLAGGPDGLGGVLANIPNGNQGWGRVSLENVVLQAPASDRGPKVFSDQRHAFTASGQEFTMRVAVSDATRPFRVTLAYSDAPGAAGANPALVNNLNLEVEEIASGDLFRGNVFANGFSNTGGVFDAVNNLECVYVQNPAGVYEVRVVATAVVANARPPFDMTPWQDFALVIDNAELADADPAKVALVLDRSGSMVSLGYVDITRQASKQFVDLLRVDDEVGVVTFGNSGEVEFPSVPPLECQVVTGPATRTAARSEIDAIAFGGCTFMGDGIQEGAALLAPESGNKAMVLFSDGYDNKGCSSDPARPSALTAAGALPGGTPIYSCAMGPTSDQDLLEQLASMTAGRYYFMPTIDDLFEIYNFIRGAATSDGIIVNDSAVASSSRVGGFVEALAQRVTFTCAWHDGSLRFTPRRPRKKNEIHVQLRNPKGKLVRHDAGYVRHHVGDGYVVFDIPEPTPGLWHIEVETARAEHTRYTVGGFVDSPIDLRALVSASRVRLGEEFSLKVGSSHVEQVGGRIAVTGTVTSPTMGVPTLLKKFKRELAAVRAVKVGGGDSFPDDVGRLLALQAQMGRDANLFARRPRRLTLRNDGPSLARGRFGATGESGSYNVTLNVKGVAANTKFVRKELLSVFVA